MLIKELMNIMVFFKQKTAYEMRMSDWSSDVCSSDLKGLSGGVNQPALLLSAIHRGGAGLRHSGLLPLQFIQKAVGAHQEDAGIPVMPAFRQHCRGLFAPGLFHEATPRAHAGAISQQVARSEEHTSELQSLMRISYAVFCLKKKN